MKEEGASRHPALQQVSLVLTLREVADYLRVHPSTIYRLLKRNEIPAFKVGSDWRFSREALDEWRVRHSNIGD